MTPPAQLLPLPLKRNFPVLFSDDPFSVEHGEVVRGHRPVQEDAPKENFQGCGCTILSKSKTRQSAQSFVSSLQRFN
ncbi:hypothetical protein L596_016847 [Steinernema carpocapsae]|uniref:Uncharacterized protein n=1 Tax=Steinernema carpocapsae TaxID=34508 RepID=A0A4U5NKN7_STECR|nr:hypothetical protein L596_016847 [Steinernema carpocapsae]